jgi:inosine-uridine nucleoside N-ribohydrolase
VRLWIDTDVGDNPDDAVALLAAGAHPRVDLVGVSTSGGRTEWRAELARELVDANVVAGERADELLRAFREAAPEAVLAIGPLTNLAAFLALGVEIPPLTVMGGTLAPVAHRGRVQAVEHNFAADPVAASVVVAMTDATIVPLDATVAMRVEDRQVDQLVRRHARLLPEISRWRAQFEDAIVLHDPLALLVCVGEPVVTIESRVLRVDARDGALRELGNESEPEEGREHAVVVATDASAAVDRVLGLLG